MDITASSILDYIKVISAIKKGIKALKESNVFAKDISVQNIIESYFTCEELPKGKIAVIGKLSNYALNADFPIYAPRDFKVQGGGITTKIVNGQPTPQLEMVSSALNVPSSTFNDIILEDNSKAKILWLFPQETEGLIFPRPVDKIGLDINNLGNIFPISDTQKPILVLADCDFDYTQFTYRTIKIVGKITTAPISSFQNILNNTSAFTRSFYNNCFRQFTESTGLLAIDIRKPTGRITILEENRSPFSITYTVQGMINSNKELSDEVKAKCSLAIPDRQNLPEHIAFIGDQTTKVYSVITINDISWQYLAGSQSYAAFININMSDTADVNAKFAKLSHHWNIWQKKAPEFILHRFDEQIGTNTTFCSNSKHINRFDLNGFTIPPNIEKALLNKDPSVREGIDWLGISIGK
ncbi:MAG TPA: hypothetical protein VK718_07840 [Ferruginibacter sp.]|jgi:hypothetical protein|nr:hypothetical protein [Ferruginibacter sp.]